jgi:sirohydrochlorin cobaltochelatase
VIEAIHDVMKRYEDDQTAICLMGHGTEAESNTVYATIQQDLADKGYKNYFVATVEATPTFEDAVKAAKDAGYTKAVLRPLMVVAGDHATNDMADTSDPESFASLLIAAGFEVTSILEGLGQIVGVDEVYVSHVKSAIDTL